MTALNPGTSSLVIDFAPLINVHTLYGLAGLSATLLLLSVFFYRRGLVTRGLCAAAFILLLANPALVHEDRTPASDTVVIAVDHSPSQTFGKRTERTAAALEYLRDKFKSFQNLDVRIVDSAAGQTGPARETRLFDKVDEALADVPAARRAGVILLTDGQVHDIPANPAHYNDYGPVHALLSGEKKERDRRLVILEAPAYGIVGQTAIIKYRVEDSLPGAWGSEASVIIQQDGADTPPRQDTSPANEDREITVTIGHAGQNIVDMETPAMDGEITPANNRVPVIINGVRDRLRVLLVSGQASAGEKTWRDLLTSDPGVDLVHFTILREPDKVDMTPQRDLALIAFPFEELFEVKLYDFDLIIFDRYRLNNILPDFYFGNIARYVKEGGALLEASGPSFAGPQSVYGTDLKSILPGEPTGRVVNESFTPALTAKGKRHPVTEGLTWPNGVDPQTPGWGPWLRQVAVNELSGDTLMSGVQNLPLLILDHVGKGRVAQLASDQIWLWSRGYKGGGPQAELLRRLAHWLMKEPELEENALAVSLNNGQLLIRRHALNDTSLSVTVTMPDGKNTIATLEPGTEDGVLQASIPAGQLGVYVIDDGSTRRFVLSGDINPPELRAVTTTAEHLDPIVTTSKGGVVWLDETPQPEINMLVPDRTYAGRNWIGLRRSGASIVTGVKLIPLLPSWAWALILLGVTLGGWWYEGRSRKVL